MADLRTDRGASGRIGLRCACGLHLVVFLAIFAVAAETVGQQSPSGAPGSMPPAANPMGPMMGKPAGPMIGNPTGPPPSASPAAASPAETVVDVQIRGNKSLPLSKFTSFPSVSIVITK